MATTSETPPVPRALGALSPDSTEGFVLHRAGGGPGTWAMGSLFEHLIDGSPAATACSACRW